MDNVEQKFKPGTAEYDADVIKRARKAATTIGKTLEHYRLIGEALSIMRQRAMEEAGLKGSNKPPSGPKYTKALDAQLDKAPEFLSPEVFEGGSARTHCVWLHDHAADVEWTFQIAERAKPGSTRRWNNPTYIWKMWRKLTKEPTKKAVDAKAAKEAKAKAQADELENYREEWKRKYEAVKAELDALKFDDGKLQPLAPGELETLVAPKPKRERKPRKAKIIDESSDMGLDNEAVVS